MYSFCFLGLWFKRKMIRRRVFFPLLFFAAISLFHNILNTSHSFRVFSSDEPQKAPIHILILSSWRSGSTFLGQIFNHHQDVFYIFEPGHYVWMKFKNEGAERLQYLTRDLLRTLFTCDISLLRKFLPGGGKKISDINFFAESRAMCSPPSCFRYSPSEGFDRHKCFHGCGNTSLDIMSETCTRHSHVVAKTVRIFDLSVLLPVFQDPTLDLRIIHLVRDPRAILSSRKLFDLSIDNRILLKGRSWNKTLTESRVMAKICKAQVTINRQAKMERPTWHGRYMLVRHEDLSLRPEEKVREMFEFAGLKMSKSLTRWLHKVTHIEEQERERFFPISKVSKNVVQQWRTKLDFRSVKEVEEVCRDAMDLFGYLPVKSEEQQKDLSVGLIV